MLNVLTFEFRIVTHTWLIPVELFLLALTVSSLRELPVPTTHSTVPFRYTSPRRRGDGTGTDPICGEGHSLDIL